MRISVVSLKVLVFFFLFFSGLSGWELFVIFQNANERFAARSALRWRRSAYRRHPWPPFLVLLSMGLSYHRPLAAGLESVDETKQKQGFSSDEPPGAALRTFDQRPRHFQPAGHPTKCSFANVEKRSAAAH